MDKIIVESNWQGLIATAVFPKLRPYLMLARYEREGGGRHNQNPRYRIGLKVTDIPDEIVAEALALEMPCVSCGKTIHPFRRTIGTRIYFAGTCPLKDNMACARKESASEEYRRVTLTLKANPESAKGTSTIMKEK